MVESFCKKKRKKENFANELRFIREIELLKRQEVKLNDEERRI